VKFFDFGLAKTEEPSSLRMKQAGAILGTAASEQVRDKPVTSC
jgi:hypothetical protein